MLLSTNQDLFQGKSPEEMQKVFDQLQSTALDYLRAKFPGVNDKVFFTHYSGRINETLSPDLISTVLTCKECDKTCANCTSDNDCALSKFLNSFARPDIQIATNAKGLQFLEIRNTQGLRCKFGLYDKELESRINESGLTRTQQNPQTQNQAMAKKFMHDLVGKDENVFLAGKRGTGKTHLSIALILEVMKVEKLQTKCEVVAEMLDKIRRAIYERQDYFSLIDSYKATDYLVLDDLGKEKQTDAACDYLFQIIDYRYRHELPTIITTNARTPDELAGWGRPDVYMPMISRLLQRGTWIPFSDGDDYRVKEFLTGGRR